MMGKIRARKKGYEQPVAPPPAPSSEMSILQKESCEAGCGDEARHGGLDGTSASGRRGRRSATCASTAADGAGAAAMRGLSAGGAGSAGVGPAAACSSAGC